MNNKASKATEFSWHLLHPRYWLLWSGLLFWRLLTALPYSVLLILGRTLGLLLYRLPTSRKSIAETNINLCFPTWSAEKRRQLLRNNFVNMGMAAMEVGMAWWWSKSRLSKLLTIEGVEHLRAVPDGQGVMLLGIHFTTLEIGGAAISMTTQMDAMYRAHKNPAFDYVQASGRVSKGHGETVVFERGDVRGTMKALKAGRTLWYGPDQDYGLKQGLFVPFFGIPAATVYATARFAQKTGAAVVPVSHIRMPGTKGYKIRFHPALESFPVGDDLVDATRINRLIETFILMQPDQYLWVHRRFKNRPEGDEDVYMSQKVSD